MSKTIGRCSICGGEVIDPENGDKAFCDQCGAKRSLSLPTIPMDPPYRPWDRQRPWPQGPYPWPYDRKIIWYCAE